MRGIRALSTASGELQRRRGVPVWGYLVVLALIPMIVVGIAGSLLVSERMGEAKASLAAERAMSDVADLDNLRNDLASELSSTAFQDAAVGFRLTRARMEKVFGAKLAVPLSEARGDTDRQLAHVSRSVPGLTGLATLKANLLASRRAFDRSLTSPAAAFSAAFQTARGFTQVLESAGALERSITDQLVHGQSGSVPPTVMFTTAQLDAVMDLTLSGAREADLLYLLIAAPQSRTTELVHQLDTVRGSTSRPRQIWSRSCRRRYEPAISTS